MNFPATLRFAGPVLKVRLPPRPAPANRGPLLRSPAMLAIATIAVFIVALAALNIYEFGRLD